MQEPEFKETQSKETTIPEINTQTGNLTKLQPPMQSQEQWLKYGQRISGFLGTLPDYVGKFFVQYQQPIVSIGLVVTGVITVKVLLAVLDALNDVPLLSTTF